MEKNTCSVEGCGRETRAEYCRAHWQRIYRTGEPGSPVFRASSAAETKPCLIDNCDRDAKCAGMCRAHYERKRKGSDVDGTPVKRMRGTPPLACRIEGCEEPRFGRGWCSSHYQRWWRTGDPGDADSRRFGLIKTCTAEGCERAHRTKGYCDTHYRRWARGLAVDSLRFLVIKERASLMSYNAAHGRIRALRGFAKDLRCECGAAAHAWAYQHNDPEELTNPAGYPYSLNFFECYEPMCRPCHQQLDRDLDERMARKADSD